MKWKKASHSGAINVRVFLTRIFMKYGAENVLAMDKLFPFGLFFKARR